MKKSFLPAILFIASCAISTGSTGQKVYRCGNEYSQIPCADSITINVDDSRSKAQKIESDTATQQQTIRAAAMEKERLKDEARLIKANTPAVNRKADAIDAKGAKDKKAHTKKKKEPEFFTARTIGHTMKKAKSANSEASTAP